MLQSCKIKDEDKKVVEKIKCEYSKVKDCMQMAHAASSKPCLLLVNWKTSQTASSGVVKHFRTVCEQPKSKQGSSMQDMRMMPSFPDTQLSQEQFSKIADVVYRLSGINLHKGKEELVKVRLSKRLRALGLGNFQEYMEVVEHEADELATMIDLLTTNKTSFFREAQHFDYFREHLLPALRATQRRIRIWSAGCSSGEEPYTLAILLNENIPNIEQEDVRILATDLSMRMIVRVRDGVYNEEVLQEMNPLLIQKYFVPVSMQRPRSYRVRDSLRAIVKVAQLNLMEPWPMKGGFDAIFCRNVMIYFDKATQSRLVNRFWEKLNPNGHLFIGHSESLTGMAHEFHYVRPAIYVK
jgi:chemotaxis protein methyltransferase CheR